MRHNCICLSQNRCFLIWQKCTFLVLHLFWCKAIVSQQSELRFSCAASAAHFLLLKEKEKMALIKCPECGQTISDNAHYCVHCGTQRQIKINLIICFYSSRPIEWEELTIFDSNSIKHIQKRRTEERVFTESISITKEKDIVLKYNFAANRDTKRLHLKYDPHIEYLIEIRKDETSQKLLIYVTERIPEFPETIELAKKFNF